METNTRKSLCAVFDFILLLIIGLAILFIYLFAPPFQRGFFCDDESIRYPYHKSTISSLAVSLVTVLAPLVVITMLEFLSDRSRRPSSAGFCCKKPLSHGLVRWLKMCTFFLFGYGMMLLVVEVGKESIGRLRPHFIAVCNPDVDCSATNVNVTNKYITTFTCLNPDQNAVKEARKSFPSGHSSTSFYSAVFTMMYLQYALPSCGSKLLRHFIQLVLFLSAWYTALSRVFDYHHHWSDVLVGSFIGVLVALLIILVVSDLRQYYATPRKRDEEESLVLNS